MTKNNLTKTGNRRDKIKNASSTVFVAVAAASVLTMMCLVSLRFFWDQKTYNSKLIGAKTEVRDRLVSNITSLKRLKSSYKDLEANSTNPKKILHALPDSYDYAGLATSINQLALGAGVTFKGSIGPDTTGSAVGSDPSPTPVVIPMTIVVEGSYQAVKQFVLDLERSTRPFHLVTSQYEGSNERVTASLIVNSYYQPKRSLDIQKETFNAQ